MATPPFQEIVDLLRNEAEKLEASGYIVKWQALDLPARTVRLRVESPTHIGEIVVWAERCQVSVCVAQLDGAFVLDQNYEVQEGTSFRWPEFKQYFGVEGGG